MKERIKGLTALWIAFALLLSASPVTVMAGEWVSTRPKDKVYIYTDPEGLTFGKELSISDLQKKESYVRFDAPFDQQTDYSPEADFMKYVMVPDGYELKEWNIWGVRFSGDVCWVSSGPKTVAPDGFLTEREYDEIIGWPDTYGAGWKVVMNPIMGCKPPVISIRLGDQVWQTFSGGVPFQTFYKDRQRSFSISAEDRGSGIGSVQYFLFAGDLFPEDKVYTPEEIEAAVPAWNNYTQEVPVLSDEDGEYVLYAKAVDREGNVSYANSGGIVIDTTAPVISLLHTDPVHVGDEVNITVVDNYIDTVTIDGSPAAAENGVYTFVARKTATCITATDKAGNSSDFIVSAEGQEGENNNISASGLISLVAGKAYILGEGTWKVAGDSTIYKGGITFYVGTSGEFDFQKQ